MYNGGEFIVASGLFVFLRAQWWVVVVSIEDNGNHEAISFDFRFPYLNSGYPLTCVRSYRQRWFTPVITQQARNALNEGATTYYYANEACNTNSYCRYRVLYYWQCSHHLYNYLCDVLQPTTHVSQWTHDTDDLVQFLNVIASIMWVTMYVYFEAVYTDCGIHYDLLFTLCNCTIILISGEGYPFIYSINVIITS